jgi:hypothetical protein
MHNMLAANAVVPPASGDPYWVNYSSLLHFDGANGSTTFTDQSGKVWTRGGNTVISTAISKFGGASAFFDGSGDYIDTPDNDDFEFGNGDFTIEAWVYMTIIAGDYRMIVTKDSTVSTRGFLFLCNPVTQGGAFQLYFQDGVTQYLILSTTIPVVNTWYHVAVARQSSSVRMFVNGVLEATIACGTATLNPTTHVVRIGKTANNTGNFAGYIDEVRITKGQAIYTANFTPQTSAHPNGRTVSLLHFDGANGSTTFADQKGKTWTPFGNAQLDTALAKFGTAAMELDGSGDYIETAANDDFKLGTGDFTVEAWVYPTNFSLYGGILGCGTSATVSWFLGILQTTGCPYFQFGTGTAWDSPDPISLNTYVHIAATRQAGTVRLFVGGVKKYEVVAATNVTDNGPVRSGRGRGGSSNYFAGGIDDARITIGVARYTTNFTPPTAAFPNSL